MGNTSPPRFLHTTSKYFINNKQRDKRQGKIYFEKFIKLNSKENTNNNCQKIYDKWNKQGPKIPFYIEGAIQGLVGGLLGILILFISFILLVSSVENEMVSGFVQVRFLPISISAAIVLLSVSAGLVGCYLSFKQFLNS